MSTQKRKSVVTSGRTMVNFNTGTRPHKSPKDYTRKPKHKVNYREAV